MLRPRNDFSFKERAVEGLKSAAVNGLQQFALSGGDWRAGLGGAIGGAGGGMIDPRVAARSRFSSTVEPALMQRNEQDQRNMAAQQALEDARLKNEKLQQDLKFGREKNDRESQESALKLKRDANVPVSPGTSLFNLNENKTIFSAPERRSMHRVGDTLVDNTGKEVYTTPRGTGEGMSKDSSEMIRAALEGPVSKIVGDSMRGRESMIISKLPPLYQKALSKPDSVDAETAMKARQAYESLYNDERRRVEEETKGTADRSNALRRLNSGSASRSPAAGTSRSLDELTSKFGELRKRFGRR
jgi:hypothetical protein